MGILLQPALRAGKAHCLQHNQGLFLCFLPGKLLVAHQGTANLFPYCKQGIQTGHGILEYHANPVTLYLPHFPGRLFKQVLTVKEQGVRLPGSIVLQQPHNRQHGHTFSAAGFPHDSQALSLPHMEGNAPYGLHAACVCGKTGAQVLYL